MCLTLSKTQEITIVIWLFYAGIKAAFAAIDLNHDGKISANELRRACKQLGILLTRDEVDEIMLEADTSGRIIAFDLLSFDGEFIIIKKSWISQSEGRTSKAAEMFIYVFHRTE